MSVSCGQVITAEIKFVQLKSFQLSNQNDSDSGQCLTIDQNRQTIFVCCQNELIFVPLNSLLNFDNWSKDILKKVDTNLENKIVVKISPNPLNSHLVSVSSKGFGTKLAVCCYDPSNSCLAIKFYSLQSLYTERENCASYNQFIVPHVSNDQIRVRMLSWHPEINDNIFACSLTDGSLYILYISDCDQKIIAVLANLPSSRNVTAFSWSPKGKQLVISFKDSRFSQFKFQINEKNLVDNIPFDEVKKINLPDEFKTYEVSNICWLSTFNFMVICYNPQENDSRYLIVSIPSAKATGPDAVIKIVDFSCINLDVIENRKQFEAYILQLENLIFSYTNRSLQISILGCPSSADIASYNKWSEVVFEDDENLSLPSWDNDSTLVCGLAFTNGTSKLFNFGSMSKGGPSRPFALTYSKFGQVTAFLSDYQNAQNENFLKVPTAPSSVTKPIVSASISSNKFPQPPQPQTPQPQPSQPQPALSFNSTTNLQPELTPTSSVESKIDNKVLIEEICANIAEFNAEISSAISEQKSILSAGSIGTSEEFEKIKCDSEFVKQMLNELSESFGSLNADVNDLQASFIELHYLLEETRAMLDRNTDPKYRDILRQRNLDPITLRNLKDIRSLTDYIDVQLREIDNKFDQEWHEWLHSKRKSKLNPYSSRKYISPTSPFQSFIDDRQRNGSTENGDKDNLCSTKSLYQAIANNQRLITNLKLQINEKIAKNGPVKMKQDFKRFSEFQNHDNINHLSNVLGKVSLSGNDPKTPNKSYNCSVYVQCLPIKQKTALKSFLENRRSVPIRTCGTCLPDDEFTKKSRFSSALEKIKLKDTKNLVPKSNNLSSSQNSDQSTLIKQLNYNSSITVNKPAEIKSVVADVSKPAFVLSSTSKPSQVNVSSGMSILQSKLMAKPESPLAQFSLQYSKATEPIPSVTVKLPIPKSKPQPVVSTSTTVDSIPKPIIEDISPPSTPPTEDKNKTQNLSIFSYSTSTSSFFKPTANAGSVFSFSNSLTSSASTVVSTAAKQTQPLSTLTKTATTSFLSPNSSGTNFSFNLGSSSPFNFGNQSKLSTLSASTVSTSVSTAATLTLQATTTATSTTSVSSSTLSSVGFPSFSTSLFSTSNLSSSSTVSSSSSFSFTKSSSNLLVSDQVKPNSETTPTSSAPQPTSASEPSPVVSSSVEIVKSPVESQQPSTVAKSEPTTTSIFTTPISSVSVPSFSTSLFGSTLKSPSPFSTSSGFSSAPLASISASPKTLEFSFNSALSGLVSKPSESVSTASVVAATSAPASTTSSFFGANSASSFSFGQPVSSSNSAITSSITSPFSFNTAQPASSGLVNSLSKSNICSPNTTQSTSSVFGSFSFGGNAASSLNSGATSPFGSLQAATLATSSTTPTSNSFFGSSASNSWSAFGNQNQNTAFGSNSTGSFGNTSSPISKQGFAVSSTASPASPAFGSTQAFGGSPVFGQSPPSVFGGAATFGSAPTFGSSPTFGSASPPVFDGSAFGNQAAASSSFSNLNTSPIFGGFAMNDNSAPTFDSLAADVNDTKPFASPVAGASFGEAFTQRRK